MIIAIEGLDASGKATQSKLLMSHLASTGRDVKRYEFPNYDSITGRALLGHLKGQWEANIPIGELEKGGGKDTDLNELNELVFQCLMLADKCAMAGELSQYAANPTNHAVLDRYIVSGRAYGGTGGLPKEWLKVTQAYLHN